jgi:ATP-dependent Clp protease protease subunit
MNAWFFKAHEIAARVQRPAGAPALAAKASDTKGSLYIYELIGEDWWTGGGVTAKKVADALAGMAGVKTLDIFINSVGGDVFEAKAIFENLKRFSAEKVVHVDGLCASAASLVAMAGDRIITAPAGTWMVHEASAGAWGRAEDLRAMADLLDMQNQDMAKTYAARTKGEVAAMLELMSAETWMDATKAKELGFTDEIAREEDDPAQTAAAAAKSPLVAVASRTQERIRAIRQERRLNELTGRRLVQRAK